MKKLSGFVHKCFALVITGIIVLTTGCSIGNKPYSEILVLTVDDSKIYMDEMMYHVMLAAMQGELYASFVGDGENYWDIKTGDGSTMREAMKDMALENAVKYELFYQLALQKGYLLTDDEKQQSRSKVDNILKNLGEEQLKTTGLTQEKLLNIQDKIAIATKYYDDYIKTLGVDEEAIKSNFNMSDYKQYDIEYIFAEKQERDVLDAIQDAADSAEDLTALTDASVLNSGKLSFLEGADTFGEESNLEEVIKAMDRGEVSDIVETVKGYYIIKLIDNISAGKYDAAVKEAVDNTVEAAFETAYESLKKEHKIDIKDKVWNEVKIDKTIIQSAGNVTEINSSGE